MRACRLVRAALLVVLLASCGDDNHHRIGTTPTIAPSPTITPTPDDVVLIELPDRLVFRTGSAAVEVERAAFHLALQDAAGHTLASQAADGVRFTCGDAECAVGAIRSYVLGASSAAGRTLSLEVETDAGPGRIELTWHTQRTVELRFTPPDPERVTHFSDAYALAAGELIYGLTERLTDSRPINNAPGLPPIDELRPREVGSLDRRGETIDMLVRATYGLYVPFYQSSNGYGLAVGGTTPGSYDIGATDPDVLRFRFETGTTADSRTFHYFLFAGPRHADILDQYTTVTGRPFVPPAWAFKHWRWRDELRIGAPVEVDGVALNAELADDLTMYEALDIPVGVYMIDRPWSDGPFGFNTFLWDGQRFPDADGMLRVLQQRGYRTVLWSAALAAGDRPGDNGTEAKMLGYLAPGVEARPTVPDAQVIDLTNPEARAWWTAKHVDFIRRYGIAGIKLDRGEEYVTVDPTQIYFDGRTGREVHNQFPVLNLQLYHDLMETARGAGDFVVAARAAYTGAQQSGIFWGGDIPGSEALGGGPGTDLGLRTAIIALQRAAFMGLPFWGTDTGGYYEFKQRDVFARWLQFSAFCPLMEIGGHGTHAPWDMPTEPHYDEEMIAIYRRYTRLHHDLIPYTMRHAELASQTGMPIARPLVFAYPDDPAVRDRWDEYLYGDDLLIAPVWRNGDRAREVYLPAGRWEDFWDGSRSFDGPSTITVDAPLDVIPVFVRAGAEIPGRP
jgi:alpha-glucosidase (family GH31 glycosyl hydrolase)